MALGYVEFVGVVEEVEKRKSTEETATALCGEVKQNTRNTSGEQQYFAIPV